MKLLTHLIYIVPNLFLLIALNFGYIDDLEFGNQFHIIYFVLTIQMIAFVYFSLKR